MLTGMTCTLTQKIPLCRNAKLALRGIAIAVLAAAALPATAIEPAALVQGLEKARLSIQTGEGDKVEIRTYIAKTAAQRSRGLMHVRSMAADEGMLFIYPRPSVLSMWMKNTYIPLDMLFADARGRIVHMHAGAVPHDTRIISSIEKVTLVVELNAGSIETYGIKTGDRVTLATE